ncbi:MAG: 16S rRNA (guanine(966)-N(2))-methyltransferase RsmD [Gemmatimonadetes bacterium]|nr:16S rRNA (guanine(966)-N(2))-methyltransferase RsmD [Gemmatimonadota bacterium]
MRIIAGQWGGRRLKTPRGRGVRPTLDRVREAWMSALSPRLGGARVLDLFAGSGALGLEALSRGAEHVTFVEKAGEALRVLAENVATLGADASVQVVRGDALRYVARLQPHAFDIALADPPYEQGLAARLVTAFLENPFAGELWVEHRTSEPMPDAPGMRQRRYGDTTLTAVAAPPPT